MNVYYDYRRGDDKHNFHQLGLGAEWLNGCWDLRINSYLPWNKSQTSAYCVFDDLGDGFFAKRHKFEYAYSGFDAEIGMPLWNCCDFSLYGAAGPYYYGRSHVHHFFGGTARLELDWRSILSLQVRVSYDKVYSTCVQGTIQVSLPLDFFNCDSCCDSCGCQCLFCEPVQRNGIILIDDCCNWTWNWDDKKNKKHE